MAEPELNVVVRCDDCGKDIGRSDRVQKGQVCTPCGTIRTHFAAKQHATDHAAVIAKGLSFTQALAVRHSSSWDALSPGKKAAVQHLIDTSAPEV